MPNIGPMELAIVAIIALVIFGPRKLPELGSSLGRGLREFKASVSSDAQDDRADSDERSRALPEQAEQVVVNSAAPARTTAAS